ncbi:unnamed protein product [Linum trigynum]
MNLDVYHSLIFGKHRLDDRDNYWGSDYFHVAASEAEASAIGGGDHGIDEDDILYAELSRQVLLLTADDDEDDVTTFEEEAQRRRFDDGSSGYGNFVMGMKRSTSVNSNEGYNNSWSNFGSAVADFTAGMNQLPYFNLWESSSAAGGGASWQGNSSWGSAALNTGTGVFIPHVANSKRRHRRGKKNGKKRAGGSSKQAGESKQ